MRTRRPCDGYRVVASGRGWKKEKETMASEKYIDVRLNGGALGAAFRVLDGLGLTVDDAVRLLLARVARERALPLEPPLTEPERASDPPARRGVRESEVVVSFKVNERVADEVLPALAALGLSVDRAVGWILARLAQEAALPFSPNAETRTAMEEARRVDLKSFDTVEALLADLNAED